MTVNYTYGEAEHRLKLCWVEKEKSIVFRNILHQMEHRHRIDLRPYSHIAAQLDKLVDSIYDYSSALTTETMTSYDPTLPRRLAGIVNQMKHTIHSLPDTEAGGVLFTLYTLVAQRFEETVNVYLDDNRLKNKERTRLDRMTIRYGSMIQLDDQEYEQYGYEHPVMQMAEVSQVLDCLTPTQRRRLVKYYILRMTQQDIADEESTTAMAIHYSIRQALKRLKKEGFANG